MLFDVSLIPRLVSSHHNNFRLLYPTSIFRSPLVFLMHNSKVFSSSSQTAKDQTTKVFQTIGIQIEIHGKTTRYHQSVDDMNFNGKRIVNLTRIFSMNVGFPSELVLKNYSRFINRVVNLTTAMIVAETLCSNKNSTSLINRESFFKKIFFQ